MNLLNQTKVVVITSVLERHRNQDRKGGASLRGELVANDDSSSELHTAIIGKSFMLKAELIPESHKMSNQSVLKQAFSKN